jgi:hypothetical protein
VLRAPQSMNLSLSITAMPMFDNFLPFTDLALRSHVRGLGTSLCGFGETNFYKMTSRPGISKFRFPFRRVCRRSPGTFGGQCLFQGTFDIHLVCNKEFWLCQDLLIFILNYVLCVSCTLNCYLLIYKSIHVVFYASTRFPHKGARKLLFTCNLWPVESYVTEVIL